MIDRRGFLLGLGAALAAPAVVRAENIMRVAVLRKSASLPWQADAFAKSPLGHFVGIALGNAKAGDIAEVMLNGMLGGYTDAKMFAGADVRNGDLLGIGPSGLVVPAGHVSRIIVDDPWAPAAPTDHARPSSA